MLCCNRRNQWTCKMFMSFHNTKPIIYLIGGSAVLINKKPIRAHDNQPLLGQVEIDLNQ